MTCVWETRYSILAAAVTAYGRIISEVGISMMVGGNIKFRTHTLATATALETARGEFARGVAMSLILLLIAFVVAISTAWLARAEDDS